MNNSNPFNKANNAISGKQNPLTMRDNFESGKHKYKSVRIHPEDFRFLRAYAFYNEMSIIDVVSLSVELLKKEKQEKEDQLKIKSSITK